eukprot:13494378-Heterocapsa_arctica.AAC.1
MGTGGSPSAKTSPGAPLAEAAMATAPPAGQTQMLGVKLFSAISKDQPAKTDMMAKIMEFYFALNNVIVQARPETTTSQKKVDVFEDCTKIEGAKGLDKSYGYLERMFMIGFTRRRADQGRSNWYAQSAQVRKIRRKMVEIM